MSTYGIIAKHTANITMANFAGTILSLAFSIIFAKLFGTSAEADAYVLAMIIPNVMYGLSNALFLTPLIYHGTQLVAKGDGRKAAQLSSNSLLLAGAIFGILALCTALITPFALQGIAPAATTALIVIISATVVVQALLSVVNGTLHVHSHFLLAHSTRILSTLGALSAILIWPNIQAAAAGYLTGCITALVIEATAARKYFSTLTINPAILRATLYNLTLYGTPLIINSLFYYLGRNLPLLFAARLGEGQAALFSYASSIFFALPPLLSEPASTVLFPHLTRLHTTRANLKQPVWISIAAILAILIPTTAVLYFGAPAFIQLLYQRGAFTANDTIATAHVLSILSLALPAVGLQSFFISLFLAHGKPWLTALTPILHILLFTLFTIITAQTATSIAASLAGAHWIVLIASLVVTRKLVGDSPVRDQWREAELR
ncbi:oligosaccharide flippase family protein [Candidatus Woesearchaeota archaeon]|nr:oligosaccharide flippase family protein [Candidatus Woesearchaeota archaeon]